MAKRRGRVTHTIKITYFASLTSSGSRTGLNRFSCCSRKDAKRVRTMPCSAQNSWCSLTTLLASKLTMSPALGVAKGIEEAK